MNRIAIFQNDKGDNPKRPDYRAMIEIDGRKYTASLWHSESKNGNKYIGGPIDAVDDANDDMAQDIPF